MEQKQTIWTEDLPECVIRILAKKLDLEVIPLIQGRIGLSLWDGLQHYCFTSCEQREDNHAAGKE